jgi:peptidase E
MDIILSGGGDLQQCKPIDLYFRKLVKRKHHILYLPTAWRRDFTGAWASTILGRIGTHETWVSVAYRKPTELHAFDGMYIGGGNTYALLDTFRSSGFLPLLKQFLKNKPVYGSSAGAIIFGADIGTAGFGGDADENLPKMKDTRGLDLLHGYAVGCHYRRIDDKAYRKYSKRHPVIALPEETGLHVEEKRITVIGTASAFLFENGEKIELPVGSVATLTAS